MFVFFNRENIEKLRRMIMFQLIMGSLVLLYTAGLVIYYIPQTFSSLYVCLLCGITGVLSIVAGGGSWIVQLIQINAQLMIAGCSLFHLHREKLFTARKAKVAMTQQRTVVAQKMKAAQKYVAAKKRTQSLAAMERCA